MSGKPRVVTLNGERWEGVWGEHWLRRGSWYIAHSGGWKLPSGEITEHKYSLFHKVMGSVAKHIETFKTAAEAAQRTDHG